MTVVVMFKATSVTGSRRGVSDVVFLGADSTDGHRTCHWESCRILSALLVLVVFFHNRLWLCEVACNMLSQVVISLPTSEL